ncbi:hypothetical protein PIB30_068366 [Stylosanthes scabra]|uniref:Uncharacterized protein n=1 Tax=Stylosanthes scabra TaxID=79078 RepID=A0ABU6YKE8_9FABA|nr:hypothetical protein [Stylosanthes scabra]
MSKQMRNWTRNAAARECYDIWAHQQLNPNLVEMPVTKLIKLIYDNHDKDRPEFQGCLKSDFEAGSSSQAAPPITPTTAPSSAPTDSIPPAQAPAPQHNQEDYYPEQFFQEKKDENRLLSREPRLGASHSTPRRPELLTQQQLAPIHA